MQLVHLMQQSSGETTPRADRAHRGFRNLVKGFLFIVAVDAVPSQVPDDDKQSSAVLVERMFLNLKKLVPPPFLLLLLLSIKVSKVDESLTAFEKLTLSASRIKERSDSPFLCRDDKLPSRNMIMVDADDNMD